MTLVSLFEAPRARRTDPPTSKRAAARTRTVHQTVKGQIVGLLARHGCAFTKDDICRQLGVHPRRWPTVASALSQLKNEGKVEWTGVVIDGQNVWKLRTRDVTASL